MERFATIALTKPVNGMEGVSYGFIPSARCVLFRLCISLWDGGEGVRGW